MSALRHAHLSRMNSFSSWRGKPTLITDEGETELSPGMCAGFKCGTGNGHHLINRGKTDVLYLEIGDRTAGDAASYPDDDLQVLKSSDGVSRTFVRKDGTPY